MTERKGYYPLTPLAEYVGTRYNPSNGTEGECFWAQWCEKCERDKHMNGTITHAEDCQPEDYCTFLGDSFRSEGTEAWVFGEDGYPKCTQFVPMGEKIPQRDDKTIDMFSDTGETR